MTRSHLIPCLLSLCAVTFGAAPSPPLWPVVAPDRHLSFALRAPAARQVLLTGSDLPGANRGLALTRDPNGPWRITIGPVDPGAYRYRFRVDGLDVLDPRNPVTSQSNLNAWSLVYVPGADFTDTRDVAHGAVAEVTYHSAVLGRARRLHVYTPPGYEAGTERYPVFYLLHGASDSDDSWTTVGRAGFILDNLLAAGKIVPMVVVMPNGHTTPWRWGQPLSNADFLAEFRRDILPTVERRYRVHTDRAHRAVAGLSMGGNQTLELLVTLPEAFGYAGVFSSGIFGIAGGRGQGPSDAWERQHAAVLDSPALRDGLRLLWFGIGRQDFLLETSRATVTMLRRHGLTVDGRETEGSHAWPVWRGYLRDLTPRLFR